MNKQFASIFNTNSQESSINQIANNSMGSKNLQSQTKDPDFTVEQKGQLSLSQSLINCSYCLQTQKQQDRLIRPCKCSVLTHVSCLQNKINSKSINLQKKNKNLKCSKCKELYFIQIKSNYFFEAKNICRFKVLIAKETLVFVFLLIGLIALSIFYGLEIHQNQIQKDNIQDKNNNENNQKEINQKQKARGQKFIISENDLKTILILLIVLILVSLLFLILRFVKNHFIRKRFRIKYYAHYQNKFVNFKLKQQVSQKTPKSLENSAKGLAY